MRADGDTVVEREADSLADGRRVAAVEAAGDVRGSDVRHDLGVGAHLPGAVALAHVAIEIDAFHSVIQAAEARAMGEKFKVSGPFSEKKDPDPFFTCAGTPTRCRAAPTAAARARRGAARPPSPGCTSRSAPCRRARAARGAPRPPRRSRRCADSR